MRAVDSRGFVHASLTGVENFRAHALRRGGRQGSQRPSTISRTSTSTLSRAGRQLYDMGGQRSSTVSRVGGPAPVVVNSFSLDDVRSGRIVVKGTGWAPRDWQREATRVDDNIVFRPLWDARGRVWKERMALLDPSGEMIGSAALRWGTDSNPNAVFVTDLEVPSRYRRRGYATRLYRAALRAAAPMSLIPERLSGSASSTTSDQARAVQRSLSRFSDIELEYDSNGDVTRMRYVS